MLQAVVLMDRRLLDGPCCALLTCPLSLGFDLFKELLPKKGISKINR